MTSFFYVFCGGKKGQFYCTYSRGREIVACSSCDHSQHWCPAQWITLGSVKSNLGASSWQGKQESACVSSLCDLENTPSSMGRENSDTLEEEDGQRHPSQGLLLCVSAMTFFPLVFPPLSAPGESFPLQISSDPGWLTWQSDETLSHNFMLSVISLEVSEKLITRCKIKTFSQFRLRIVSLPFFLPRL